MGGLEACRRGKKGIAPPPLGSRPVRSVKIRGCYVCDVSRTRTAAVACALDRHAETKAAVAKTTQPMIVVEQDLSAWPRHTFLRAWGLHYNRFAARGVSNELHLLARPVQGLSGKRLLEVTLRNTSHHCCSAFAARRVSTGPFP